MTFELEDIVQQQLALPRFKANQLLKHQHLNDLSDYLIEQIGLTRAQLLGKGIICGLEAEVSFHLPGAFHIHLTNGYGITSLGHLMSLSMDSVYTHWRSLTLPNPRFIHDDRIIPDSPTEIICYELLTQEQVDESDANPTLLLTAGISDGEGNIVDVSCFYLLLLASYKDEDFGGCLQSCDETGSTRAIKLTPILVAEPDLDDTKLNASPLAFTSPETVLSPLYGPRLDLRVGEGVPITPFQDKNTRPITVADWPTLQAYYKAAIEEVIPEVAKAYKEVNKQYHTVLDGGGESGFEGLETLLTTALEDIVNASSTTDRYKVYDLQYFYDFIKDLVTAYQEFYEVSGLERKICQEDMRSFPNYLIVGKLPENLPTGGLEDKPVLGTNRTHFIKAEALLDHTVDQGRLSFLYMRMQALVQKTLLGNTLTELSAFHVPAYESDPALPSQTSTRIKVVPSKEKNTPLGMRSLPYYMNKEATFFGRNKPLRDFWNYELSRKGRQQDILSYHTLDEASKAQNPLRFNIDDYPFFRIEGHVGHTLSHAFSEVNRFRKTYNLPFDIIALRLDGEFHDEDAAVGCYFEELEVQYAGIKEEIHCLLAAEILLLESPKDPAENPYAALVGKEDEFLSVFYDTLTRLSSALADSLTDTLSTSKGIFHPAVMLGRKAKNYSLNNNKIKIGAGDAQISPTSENTYTASRLVELQDELATLFQEQAPAMAFGDPPDLGDTPNLTYSFESTPALPVSFSAFYNTDNKGSIYSTLPDIVSDFQTLYYYLLSLIKHLPDSANHVSLSHRLAKLQACLPYEALKALYHSFLKQKEEAQRMHLFAPFADAHPGIAHLAGVPRGGTFILTYIDQDTLSGTGNTQKKELLRNLIHTDPEFSWQISQLREADKIVVADFALSYRCCGGQAQLSYMIPQPRPVILLEKTEFCQGAEKCHQIFLYPEGGLVMGEGVRRSADGYEFCPDSEEFNGITESKNVLLTYLLDGVKDTFEVEVHPATVVYFDIEYHVGKNQIEICTDKIVPGEATEFKNLSHEDGIFWAALTDQGVAPGKEDFEKLAESKVILSNYLDDIGETTKDLHIEYRYTPATGCPGIVGKKILIKPTPVVSFSIPAGSSEICSDNIPSVSPIILSPTPSGGAFYVFLGDPGLVDPSRTDYGFTPLTGNTLIFSQHISLPLAKDQTLYLQYEYTENGCTVIVHESIHIKAAPDVDFTVDTAFNCAVDGTKKLEELFTLTPSSADAHYTAKIGDNASVKIDDQLTLEDLGSFTDGLMKIEITRTETAVNGCSASKTESVFVGQTPDPQVDIAAELCSDASSISLPNTGQVPNQINFDIDVDIDGEAISQPVDQFVFDPQQVTLQDVEKQPIWEKEITFDLSSEVDYKDNGTALGTCSGTGTAKTKIFKKPEISFEIESRPFLIGDGGGLLITLKKSLMLNLPPDTMPEWTVKVVIIKNLGDPETTITITNPSFQPGTIELNPSLTFDESDLHELQAINSYELTGTVTHGPCTVSDTDTYTVSRSSGGGDGFDGDGVDTIVVIGDDGTNVLGRGTATPESPSIAGLSQRYADYLKDLKALEADKTLSRTKPFRLIQMFAPFVGQEASLLERYQEVIGVSLTSMRRAKGNRQKAYEQLIRIVTALFLDKWTQAAEGSPSTEGLEQVADILAGFKKKGVDMKALKAYWDGIKISSQVAPAILKPILTLMDKA